MTDKEQGIKLGLRAAATFLRCTADDYDQMAANKGTEKPVIDAVSVRQQIATEARILKEKAQLLRGQAEQIRELRVTEGRR